MEDGDQPMVTLNDLARSEFLNLVQMTNFEIESMRVAEFKLGDADVSAVGVIKKHPDKRGYYFEPQFLHITEEVAAALSIEEGGSLLTLGHPEPSCEQ